MTKHGPKPAPLRERLMKYVRVERDCWIWTGAIDKGGYGRVSYGHANCALAHRLAYNTFIEPVPDYLTLDHLCRNRACINPLHLEPVTKKVNCTRGLSGKHGKGGLFWRAKTHCPKGHPYDLLNTYFNKKGHRFCRLCHRHRAIKRYWRLKLEGGGDGQTRRTKSDSPV